MTSINLSCNSRLQFAPNSAAKRAPVAVARASAKTTKTAIADLDLDHLDLALSRRSLFLSAAAASAALLPFAPASPALAAT